MRPRKNICVNATALFINAITQNQPERLSTDHEMITAWPRDGLLLSHKKE